MCISDLAVLTQAVARSDLDLLTLLSQPLSAPPVLVEWKLCCGVGAMEGGDHKWGGGMRGDHGGRRS